MKIKHILILALVCLFTIASSVTVSKVITTPAKPTKIFVKYFINGRDFIQTKKELSDKGWTHIDESVCADQYGNFSFAVLTMYKYK